MTQFQEAMVRTFAVIALCITLAWLAGFGIMRFVMFAPAYSPQCDRVTRYEDNTAICEIIMRNDDDFGRASIITERQ